MSQRSMFGLVVLLLSAPFAEAGPLPWGFRFEDSSGALIGERSGLTDTIYVSFDDGWFLAPPLWPDPPTEIGSGYATTFNRSAGRVQIVDESTNTTSQWMEITFDRVAEWEYDSFNSVWEPIAVYELYSPFTPGVMPPPEQIGANRYSLSSESGGFVITAEAVPAVPEPSSLILVGIAGGGLLLRRRRQS